MTTLFVKSYVFADSQGSRLFFPVVENVLTQMHIQLTVRTEFMIWILECISTKKNISQATAVVLKLCKHAEPLPSFCRTPFLSRTKESKNGLLKSDDLRRTPETAPSNPVYIPLG